MTLTLTEEEQEIVLETLKARLSDLRAEMTRTDSAEFNARLKRQEQNVQGLIKRLGAR